MKLAFFKRKTKRKSAKNWRVLKRRERSKRFKAARDRIYWARFLGYLGYYKGTILALIGMILLGGAVGLVMPGITRFVLDHVVPRRDYRLLNWVILAGLGVYIAHAIVGYFQQKLITTFSMNLITQIRRDLFRHQLKLPLSYYENNTTGKLISKLTYSISTIRVLVETVAFVCFREMVLIVMLVVAAGLIDFRLTLIFLALAPVFWLYLRYLNRYMREVAVLLQTKNDQILRILDRAFHSVKLFQVFGNDAREVDRFQETLDQDKTYRIKRTLVYSFNAILIYFLSSVVILAALWYGGRQIIRGQLSHGQVVAYLVCLGMVFRPAAEFVRASAYLQAGLIGIRTVFSVFENTSPIEEPVRPICPVRRKGRVEFRRVWFRYAKGRGGLKNASFTVEAGQKVLIVGRSGAGKSTLFNLLLRLYDCERGTLLLDNVPIRRMLLQDLRAYFSVVTQDQLHVEDTVLNNIFFGSGDSVGGSAAQLEKALEIGRNMEMNRFITSLQRRFGQKVDSSGQGYSRGELQKLAMMRAASKDAPIVLMDEPTASLDPRSEKEIVRIIDEQFKHKTALIISHRPLPQLNPDWVVVLRNGWIDAQGKHEDLLKFSKYYRQMLRLPDDEPQVA
jgi:ABC-type multidrug transport system, ATPase and permease components